MSDDTNNKSEADNDPKTKPVHDIKSLLPSTHTKEKAEDNTLEAEIAVEVEDGQVSPDELNSSNDN